MTEYERVKKLIIKILSTDNAGVYYKPCPHNRRMNCPECVANAILAIPGLFVHERSGRKMKIKLNEEGK